MFSETPTVDQVFSPSEEVTNTRTRAAVARSGLSTRTAKSTSLIFARKGWREARASRRQ